jgi:ParB-like chromosome segregation protein Spo0J
MNAEPVGVESVREDPENARVHGPEGVAAIAASLLRFGQRRPILARKDGVVIAGNGTLRAARELGWKKILVRWTTLDAERARKYAIADNRAGELSEFDYAELKDQVTALGAASVGLGFSDTFLADLAATEFKGEEVAAVRTVAVELTAEQWASLERAMEVLRTERGFGRAGRGAIAAEACARLRGKA